MVRRLCLTDSREDVFDWRPLRLIGAHSDPNKRIPPGAPNWETLGELEFGEDAQLVWLMPHMHLRGKDMTFSLIAPHRSEWAGGNSPQRAATNLQRTY